ncbi:transaldolase [Paraphotobacterium marinum]|uniref:Transaldolase n=1 Tax=Paraphotobacterium marinum TaxID=1755811 RepID=A0A220VHJ4_9GAMM|nr:transaldolase [Paraphotobacterium marinum]ASK79720.1 transaldolase [Paraphotobacterium marinum]
METQLSQLKKITDVVADTGDIQSIIKYKPSDATTNPSLILKSTQLDEYKPFINEAVQYASAVTNTIEQKVELACDYLAVKIGKEILNHIPGLISTEVDARLSYNTDETIRKAETLISLYEQLGVNKSRVLIKIASTWEGIQAAKILEQKGIHCNLTLLFSMAQAKAAADAGVYLISPFVGRIYDWYVNRNKTEYVGSDDPGVKSVKEIFSYYKKYNFKTIVMGASFRNTSQILELAGCDKLTISPQLLEQLSESRNVVSQKLNNAIETNEKIPNITHQQFLWEHNSDLMAVEKLAEGILLFARDQEKLEEMIKQFYL